MATQGYQVIVTQSADFNTLGPKLWYHKFTGSPKPGSLCQPHNFTLGDSVTTSYTVSGRTRTTNTHLTLQQLFEFNVFAANTNDPLASSISYSGTNLDNCDVWGLNVDANVESWTVETQAIVYCTGHELPILMSASYKVTGGASGSLIQNYLRLNIGDILSKPPAEIDISHGTRSGPGVVNEM